MSISTVQLNDGTYIPCLAFGTGTALYNSDSTEPVLQATKTGYHHIDAAQVYANEEFTGKAIADSQVPREKLYVTSKCGTSLAKDGGGDINAREALEASLKKLGIAHVDLYLLHSPFVSKSISKSWAELEKAQADGLVKSIGVSNYRISDLEELLKNAKVTPAVNQIEYHPLLHKISKPLLEFCKSKGIAIACYGTLTTLTRDPAKGSKVDGVVQEIALAKGWTEAQVLLKWGSQTHGGIVVTTSGKKERLEEQKQRFIKGELTSSELEQIDTAAEDRVYRHGFLYMDQN